MAEDWLEVLENCADRLSNNLRLNEISILNSQFYFKINRNQLEIVVKVPSGLHPNKYVEVLHLTLWVRSLVTRSFGLHSNSRGADEIKGLPISADFCNRNTELLLLFSIISLWWKNDQIRQSFAVKKNFITISYLKKIKNILLKKLPWNLSMKKVRLSHEISWKFITSTEEFFYRLS